MVCSFWIAIQINHVVHALNTKPQVLCAFTIPLSVSLGTVLILVDLSYVRRCLFVLEICSEDTGANVRLAAAKAVLLLSRKWDLHISPEVFRLTILMAKVKGLPSCQQPNNLEKIFEYYPNNFNRLFFNLSLLTDSKS